jgi:hypothetical protein
VISLAVAAAGWVLLVTRRLRRYTISTTFETPPYHRFGISWVMARWNSLWTDVARRAITMGKQPRHPGGNHES